MRLLPDRDRYDPLGDLVPAFVLDEHPDGEHLALMAIASPYNRSAVWGRISHRVVWQPETTQALCWFRPGNQVALVRDGPPSPERNVRFLFERRSWPSGERQGSCQIASDQANWCTGVVASPRGDIVAVVWLEQHVGGFELVAIHPAGDHQIAGAGYAVEPNCISTPAFSPDGRYLVLGCGRFASWNTDEDPEMPSPGGRFRLGHVLVHDLDTGTQREVPIEEEISAGWMPEIASGETSVDQPIGDPRFESPTDFSLQLLTGRRRRLSVTNT